MYYSHHRIIKCESFKLIHCVINLNVEPFSMLLANLILYFFECITSLNQ